MTHQPTGTDLPGTITEPMAFEAYRFIMDLTDWRLRVACLDPITVVVEYDLSFAECLSGFRSWKSRDQARAWVVKRVLEICATFDKTYIRRLSLQLPRSIADEDTKLFLDHLKRRVEDTIRRDLRSHFDLSIRQWEQDALDFMHGDHDATTKVQFYNYVGLDQIVSADDMRKAIKAVFTRMHWYLEGRGRSLVLVPDHLFPVVASRRGGRDDTTRARSLVARAVQVLIEDNVQRQRDGQSVAGVSRGSLRDIIERRFQRDGVWGVVDLVVASDRQRYCLPEPRPDNEVALALIERQSARLFEPWSERTPNLLSRAR